MVGWHRLGVREVGTEGVAEGNDAVGGNVGKLGWIGGLVGLLVGMSGGTKAD